MTDDERLAKIDENHIMFFGDGIVCNCRLDQDGDRYEVECDRAFLLRKLGEARMGLKEHRAWERMVVDNLERMKKDPELRKVHGHACSLIAWAPSEDQS